MVIVFSDEVASVAASVYAVVSALHGSLKTVILQFSDKLPAEDILTGERSKHEGVSSDALSNTGMDALLRYQSFSTLTKEHFNMCVTPVLKTANLLDLVAVSQIESFTRDIVCDSERIREIVTVAEAIYDNVVIVLGSAESEMSGAVKRALGSYEYKAVKGIRQGEKTIFNRAEANEFFLIHDYNSASFFTVKYYRKLLNSMNVSVLPYNVSFRDAYLSGDLLMFLRKNIAVDNDSRRGAMKEDANAEFVMQILEFTSKLNSEMNAPASEECTSDDMCWEHKRTARTGNIRRIINGEHVFIKEEGRIRKRKVVTLSPDGAGNAVIPDTGRISNYMYKTSRITLDRLLSIAKSHKRSINDELNHIVNNYIYYIEASAAAEKKSELKRSAPVRKALIS